MRYLPTWWGLSLHHQLEVSSWPPHCRGRRRSPCSSGEASVCLVRMRILQETQSVRGGRRVRKCCVAASHVETFVITHDVDINISFILALSIPEYNLVDSRLVSPGVDNRQVHIVVPAEQRGVRNRTELNLSQPHLIERLMSCPIFSSFPSFTTITSSGDWMCPTIWNIVTLIVLCCVILV